MSDNWVVQLINQGPVYQALEMIDSVMLDKHVTREEAVKLLLPQISQYRRELFQRINNLNMSGKSVAEITDILVQEAENG